MTPGSLPPADSSTWPECQSSMVRGLATLTDPELLHLQKQNPEAARYFICLFCRHEQTIEHHLQQTVLPSELPQRLHQVWQRLHRQLGQLDPRSADATNLRTWLIQQTSAILQGGVEGSPLLAAPVSPLFSTGSLSLARVSPALVCFLLMGLERLPGDLRFIVLLHDRFHWSTSQIAAQLKLDGYILSPSEITEKVEEARQRLFQELPADIRALYLTTKP
ncbi:MAG: hypothetical protein NW237_08045 [Cyanobacteriota bacterium]|nr:hypothetical protein [Cyanobacteriota bacterium]